MKNWLWVGLVVIASFGLGVMVSGTALNHRKPAWSVQWTMGFEAGQQAVRDSVAKSSEMHCWRD